MQRTSAGRRAEARPLCDGSAWAPPGYQLAESGIQDIGTIFHNGPSARKLVALSSDSELGHGLDIVDVLLEVYDPTRFRRYQRKKVPDLLEPHLARLPSAAHYPRWTRRGSRSRSHRTTSTCPRLAASATARPRSSDTTSRDVASEPTASRSPRVADERGSNRQCHLLVVRTRHFTMPFRRSMSATASA